MPAYLVEAPEKSGQTLLDGKVAAVVFAADATDAVAAAKSLSGADSDARWADATVTEVEAAADAEGLELVVSILTGTAPAPFTLRVVGEAADTLDDLAAAMVVALDTVDGLTPSYDAGTNVLTVAAAGDSLGDQKVAASIRLNGVAVPSLVGTITDEGAAGAALTVALAADAAVLPKVLSSFSR